MIDKSMSLCNGYEIVYRMFWTLFAAITQFAYAIRSFPPIFLHARLIIESHVF